MAYDLELADRIRELIAHQADVSEVRMFGGLAFLVGGNMAIAASGTGGVLVRAEPDTAERMIAKGAAQPMVMRGRPMLGWLRVDAAKVRTTRDLTRWVTIGTTMACGLPAKPRRAAPPRRAPR